MMKKISSLLLLLVFIGFGFARVSSINTETQGAPERSSVLDKIKQNKQETTKEILKEAGTFIETSGSFTDIKDHQYQESILYLQSLGVVKGYPDGSYGPDRTVTRAEMMKIILESAVGENVGSGKSCFPDITDQWFAKYVCYGFKNKIVRGYPNGTFGPNNSVTFAEGLKITLETFDAPVKEGTGSQWFQPYLDYVHNNNLFSKYALYPERAITRGEMAFLAHQLLLESEGKIQFDGNRENFSNGCGQTPPRKVPSQSLVNGITRNYITVVGKNYNKNTPTKLIFAYHGRTNSNKQVQGYYGIDKASGGNAIIVYPLGLPESGPSRSWNTNFAIFDTLYQEFTDNYCVDLDEVYAMGHSLGAWYTNSLACARGDKIRATGSIGGGTTRNNCTGPVASLIMHNPDDRLAAFSSGLNARDQLIEQNQCTENTTKSKRGGSRGNCVEYTGCLEDSSVVRCPHSDSTSWNGSYYPHTRPDTAGKEIRNFFTTHG